MKKFKQYSTTPIFKFIGILLITIVIISCGKDGAIGPKGDTGAPGAAGSQGSQGIPGKEGAVILSGTGVPSSTTGNNGDMYLDKSTSNLYGPKSAAGWGTPLGLKGENGQAGAAGQTGATGQAGTNGATILNGTTVPTTVGINGDYYLNKTNADLYGPKTAAGWGTPINLRGNANVVASSWMNLKTWTNNGLNFYRDVSYDIPSPVLNAVGYTSLGEMIDKGGAFMVYFNHVDWSYQVPVTIVTVSPNMIVNWQISKSTNSNSFLFSVSGANNSALNTDLINNPGNGNYRIRYVLIPAGTQLPATANLKNMSHEQVKGLLNLKD